MALGASSDVWISEVTMLTLFIRPLIAKYLPLESKDVQCYNMMLLLVLNMPKISDIHLYISLYMSMLLEVSSSILIFFPRKTTKGYL